MVVVGGGGGGGIALFAFLELSMQLLRFRFQASLLLHLEKKKSQVRMSGASSVTYQNITKCIISDQILILMLFLICFSLPGVPKRGWRIFSIFEV